MSGDCFVLRNFATRSNPGHIHLLIKRECHVSTFSLSTSNLPYLFIFTWKGNFQGIYLEWEFIYHLLQKRNKTNVSLATKKRGTVSSVRF
jgi:hypothetical protein